VAYVTNYGGCKSRECNNIAREIWLWAIERNNWLSSSHIPGMTNNCADSLSRKFNPDTEWKLNTDIFNRVIHTLVFEPNIDLFASRLNYQLKPFVSYRPDPESIATDAFSIENWGVWKFYAFPPFSVICVALQKVLKDKATGIIIVPNWPTQPWYPKLLKMLIKPPMFLSRKMKLLTAPQDHTIVHPLHAKLDLLACLISGQH
jgi:hypothetical protein